MIESNFLHILFAHSVIKTVWKITVCTKGGLYVKGLALFCFLNFRIGGDSINGNYFLLPNSIFDEDMKPRDFAVYSFLVSRKDSVGECWYSVERIAEYCNISVNTARRALHWLEEWGYIEIKKSFLGGVQQTNLYKVHKIAAWHQFWESNNIKAFHNKKMKDNKLNQNRYKTWFMSICRGHKNK